MDRWKAEVGRVREEKRREEEGEERSGKRKSQKTEDAGAGKGFQLCGAPEGGKGGSLRRRVRSHLGRWEMKSCTPLWREAHFQVKMHKTHHARTTFGSWDVKKLHAVVAWSAFPSQNVQNTPGPGRSPDHFWQLRCRKSARSCGAKHISKSKCTKHTILGLLLEVEMSNECAQLWREAHFQVKSGKIWGVRTTFGRSDIVFRGRLRRLCTLSRVSKTWGLCSSFNYNHHYTPLHYNYNYNYNYDYTCNYTNYIALHYTPPHYTTLDYTTLDYTTLQLQLQLQLQLHYTTLITITLHYTNYTTLRYATLTTARTTATTTTTLHYIGLHYATLNYIIQFHYTTTTTT